MPLKAPPAIKHLGPPPRSREAWMILDRAMNNFKLPSAAKRLMLFYAAQSSGFRPCLKLVSDKTGINKYNISRTRSYLVTSGFIYHNPDLILISWYRIWIFSTLTPRLMGAKKHWIVNQLQPLAEPVFKRKRDDKVWKLALLVQEYLKQNRL